MYIFFINEVSIYFLKSNGLDIRGCKEKRNLVSDCGRYILECFFSICLVCGFGVFVWVDGFVVLVIVGFSRV